MRKLGASFIIALVLGVSIAPIFAQVPIYTRPQAVSGGGGGGTPGGSNGQIQYNNAGSFGGLASTGTGNPVRETSPTLVTPNIGAATGTSLVLSGDITANNLATAGTITSGSFCSAASSTSIQCTTAPAAGQILNNNAFTATPTLGASGTLGSLTLGNATSGTVTLAPVAGALGTVTVSLPATTGTAMVVMASGTAAMGTGAITANTCATVVTPSASSGSLTGVATTDVILWSPNADPNAITGYGKASADGLKVYVYPTANTVNFLVCNGSGSSITPGALTFNWKVVR